MKRDLRSSLLLKCTAVAVVLASGTLCVLCASAALAIADGYGEGSEIGEILSNLSGGDMLFAAVVLALLAAAGTVYLCCAAGHRKNRGGVTLNWLDKIPLDVLLLVSILPIGLAISYIEHFLWYADTYQGFELTMKNAGFAAMVAVVEAVALAVTLTLATRLKKGRWWRNTLCGMAIRACKRFFRWAVNGTVKFVMLLPLAWRTVVGVGAVLLTQSIMTLASIDSFLCFLAVAALDGALVVMAVWLTRQFQMVKEGGRALAAGKLDAKIDTGKLYRDVKEHAEDLNAIGQGMNVAVEQRLKSERLKTELITNVSHDIKTPLTAIVSYVDLLKKEELPPQAEEYLLVLERQANRLKKLTEDLVEASKASTGNVSVHMEPIVINEIVHQAVGDYDEKLAAGKLEAIVSSFEGNLMALADGRLLWRVLDNLLNNVCKYAMPGTRVYVDLGVHEDGMVFLAMKNISRDMLNIRPDELLERFVRGDSSRHTEGSGLGLNIAKSLMDLMGGGFDLSVDGDLFKAQLTLQPWDGVLPEDDILNGKSI